MTDRPHLSVWMTGAAQDHPLRRVTGRPDAEQILDAVDLTIAAVDSSAPPRLDGKRREFRSLHQDARWFDLRSELLVARWVLGASISFEFGRPGRPNPDILVSQHGLGVEVTRRSASDVAGALRRTLMKATQGVTPRPHPVVRLHGDLLAVRRGVLLELAEVVAEAARSGHRHVDVVLRPRRDGFPAVTAKIALFGGPSAIPKVVRTGATASMQRRLDLEDLVEHCLTDPRKQRQAAAMPTVLLIDVSDMPSEIAGGDLKLRSKRLADVLARSTTTPFAGVGLVNFSADGELRRITLASRATTTDAVERVGGWAAAMGITTRTPSGVLDIPTSQ